MTTETTGIDPWVVTVSGRRLNPLDPDLTLIDPADIGHNLACINRYCGATARPISVAQHAVFVSFLAEHFGNGANAAYHGLHHDDAEYLLGEVTKWLKASRAFEDYRVAEERVQRRINKRLHVIEDTYTDYIDSLMARFEIEEGFGTHWNPGPGALKPCNATEQRAVRDVCMRLTGRHEWPEWPWREAKQRWLDRHWELHRALGLQPGTVGAL